jgi:hypothetical protein
LVDDSWKYWKITSVESFQEPDSEAGGAFLETGRGGFGGDFAEDAHGIQHKPAGPGGGQFAPKGTGGGGAAPEPSHHGGQKTFRQMMGDKRLASMNGRELLSHIGQTAAAAEHGAKELIGKGVDKLPDGLPKAARAVFKLSMLSYSAGHAAATQAAAKSGLPTNTVSRIGQVLAIGDVIGMKAVPLALELLDFGAPVAIAGSFVPIASSAYLAWTFASHAIGRLQAAVKVISAVRGAFATAHAEGDSAMAGPARQLVKRLAGKSDDDQANYLALVCVALDATHDLPRALALVDKALQNQGARRFAEDVHGMQHKGKGPGGGQFVKKGQGGGGAATAPAPKKPAAKKPAAPPRQSARAPAAPATTPAKQQLTSQEISAITEKRAAEHYPELKEKYLRGGGGSYDAHGNLTSVNLNTDDWRPLFPEYHGTNAADVHEASGTLNKRLFTESLQTMKGKGNNTMVVLAGGGGSGKGTAVGQFFDQAQYPIRLDQVSDNVEKLEGKLDEAIKAGYKAEYLFVDRPPELAWKGVVGRAVNARKAGGLARTVPLEIALKANLAARQTAIEMLQRRHDIPVRVIDNSRGPGEARMLTDRNEALAHLKSQVYDHEKLLEKMRHDTLGIYERGDLPHDIAEGLVGAGAVATRRAQLRRPS